MRNNRILMFVSIGVAILAGAGVLWLFQNSSAFEESENSSEQNAPFANNQEEPSDSENSDEDQNLTASFSEQLQQKVVAEMGQPIEGFEPFMFLNVYPGLREQDFNGADAIGGQYVFEAEELTYREQNEGVATSADQALTEQGMRTVLENVAARLDIPLENQIAIDTIITALETNEE